ncbi:MAG TPA: hypothetical protein VMN56_13770 [Casimicrobiaceae bacterium]|nr:hypothetical protein [Casimicrobiaceae bacterium]
MAHPSARCGFMKIRRERGLATAGIASSDACRRERAAGTNANIAEPDLFLKEGRGGQPQG